MMYRTYPNGIIEVITGPMFSGKSEELIKRINILKYAKTKTLIIKPAIDTRWSKFKIASRSGSSIDTVACKDTDQIADHFEKGDYDAIAIDEVQFFDSKVYTLIKNLADDGIRVIVSGLDRDYTGKPYGPMPKILAIADMVDKQLAVCNTCGRAATMTFRKTNDKEQNVIGDNEYEPRCRECHKIGMKAKIRK